MLIDSINEKKGDKYAKKAKENENFDIELAHKIFALRNSLEKSNHVSLREKPISNSNSITRHTFKEKEEIPKSMIN
jgi:hypothetical protein